MHTDEAWHTADTTSLAPACGGLRRLHLVAFLLVFAIILIGCNSGRNCSTKLKGLRGQPLQERGTQT